MSNSNKTTIKNARHLRKHTTKEEDKLWYQFLHSFKPRFHRQYAEYRFILDFYYPKSKLAIELDGSQHYEEENAEYDSNRSEFLKGRGIRVLRFSNYEVNNKFNSVCEAIKEAIGPSTVSDGPPSSKS